MRRKKEEEIQKTFQNQQLRNQMKQNQENTRSRLMSRLKEDVNAIKQTIKVRSTLICMNTYICNTGNEASRIYK